MQKEIIYLIDSINEQNKVFYIKDCSIFISQGSICLYQKLGPLIDIIWDSSKGNMFLATAKDTITAYKKQNRFEIYKAVQFRHAHICPYYEKEFLKSQKFYKPCACVLLLRQEDQNILVTRRKLSMNSFPGAWVLPGGHLQKGEGLLEGGMRQAQQQVGLQIKQAQVLLDHGLMAWESAFCVDNRIVSSNVVLFFSLKVKEFEVKIQQSEIEEYKWKDSKLFEDEHKYCSVIKNGYGEAHLNYLSFYRSKNYKIQQTKPWVLIEKK